MSDYQFIKKADVLPLLRAVVGSFVPDPGTSDLDDEQPCRITIPLGEYRRAVRLLFALEKLKEDQHVEDH